MPNFEYKSKYSGADGIIHTGSGVLHAVNITASGATSSSGNDITIYDNTAASGNIIFQAVSVNGGPALENYKCEHLLDINFNNGLYINHSGAVYAVISYKPKY